jgi:hypothetical protein
MFINTRIDLEYVQISHNLKKLKRLLTLHGEGLSTLFLEVESVNLRQEEIMYYMYTEAGRKWYQSKR